MSGQTNAFCSGINVLINPLWPSGTIWRHTGRSGSALAQVMACCLTESHYYVNQIQPILTYHQWVPWHSFESDVNLEEEFENHIFKITTASYRGQWVWKKSGECDSFTPPSGPEGGVKRHILQTFFGNEVFSGVRWTRATCLPPTRVRWTRVVTYGAASKSSGFCQELLTVKLQSVLCPQLVLRVRITHSTGHYRPTDPLDHITRRAELDTRSLTHWRSIKRGLTWTWPQIARQIYL